MVVKMVCMAAFDRMRASISAWLRVRVLSGAGIL